MKDITPAQARELADLELFHGYIDTMNKRLDERRIKNKIPDDFTVHELGADGSFVSQVSVLMVVDRSTAGQFAFVGRNIAFLNPRDLTMFLVAYIPSEPLRIS